MTAERHRVHGLVVVAAGDRALPIGLISTSNVIHAMSAHSSEDGAVAMPAPAQPTGASGQGE